MRIMALDLGFTCGYGVLGRNNYVRSGSHAVKGSSIEMGEAFRSLRAIILKLAQEHKPTKIVAAYPFIGRKITPTQLRPIMGFDCKAQEVADELGVPFEHVYESDARGAFLGEGMVPRTSKFVKLAVHAECVSRRWPACDGHASDALCIAALVLDRDNAAGAAERTPLFRNAPKRRKAA